MLSSAGKQEDIRRCRELGVAAYLTKPVQQSALLNAILTALDRPLAANPPITPAGEPNEHPHRRQLRVLVADDNAVNQKLARRVLEKRRCLVETVNSGVGVLRALESHTFDLVLMDIQMPEMDGFEATAAIRRTEELTGEHMPIIALTAHAMKGDRERCLASGMDGYIAKPIQVSDLFALIDRLLPPPKPHEEAYEPPQVEDVVDEISLRDRVDSDEALLRELIELFRTDCPTSLKQIGDAVAAGSARELEVAAHSFKGAIGTFAAKPAFDAASRLEAMGRDNRMDGASQAFKNLEIEIDRLQSALAAISVLPVGSAAQ
jgi:CheY-like chemotaxis protein